MNGTDGVDHINVYSKGQTELGRWLSNFAHTPFDLADDGHFESVEGYWYWLSCRDERLRHATGYAAKQLGRQIRTILGCDGVVRVDNFEEKIRRALDAKLKANPRMLQLFAHSTLPLAHYYEYDGIRKDAGYHWILDHLEARRQLLRQHWKLDP